MNIWIHKQITSPGQYYKGKWGNLEKQKFPLFESVCDWTYIYYVIVELGNIKFKSQPKKEIAFWLF